MEMANARSIEKNAFIVLNNSFLTALMRLPDWASRTTRRVERVEKIQSAFTLL